LNGELQISHILLKERRKGLGVSQPILYEIHLFLFDFKDAYPGYYLPIRLEVYVSLLSDKLQILSILAMEIGKK
jgi:hypothetical protein